MFQQRPEGRREVGQEIVRGRTNSQMGKVCAKALRQEEV